MAQEVTPGPSGQDMKALIKESLVEVLQENPQLLEQAMAANTNGRQNPPDETGKL